MAVTPNIGLTEPVQGTTPWDAIVNGNMTIIDNCFGGTQIVPAIAVTVLKPGLITQYNGVVTAGGGVSAILGATSQKTESAADATLLSFTPPAVAGSYRLNFVMCVSAASSATLGWTATWKDSNSFTQAPGNLTLFQTGIAAPVLTVSPGANNNFYGQAQIDTDNSATPIVVKLTFSGTSFTAKVTATVERLV